MVSTPAKILQWNCIFDLCGCEVPATQISPLVTTSNSVYSFALCSGHDAKSMSWSPVLLLCFIEFKLERDLRSLHPG